jgi:hypothetical protein
MLDAEASSPVAYMSVKDAIREQEMARQYNETHRPLAVRLPPTWAELHVRSALGSGRTSPPGKLGFPRSEEALAHPVPMTASCSSSVGHDAPAAAGPRGGHHASAALGGSSRSGLNHTSTYFYGEAPLKPLLCSGNRYNQVGSYSMFGSQVRAPRPAPRAPRARALPTAGAARRRRALAAARRRRCRSASRRARSASAPRRASR